MARLRAAGPNERAPRRLTVTQAAETGDRRALLIAMRERIAKAVEDDGTPARDLAALTKRLADVARDIAELDAASEGDTGVYDGGATDWQAI